MEQSFCGQYDAALFFWTKFNGNPALNCTEVRFDRILSNGNNWLLLRFVSCDFWTNRVAFEHLIQGMR